MRMIAPTTTNAVTAIENRTLSSETLKLSPSMVHFTVFSADPIEG